MITHQDSTLTVIVCFDKI